MQTHKRYLISRKAWTGFGFKMPEAMLDYIEEQYFVDLLMYRIINVGIGIVAMIIWAFLKGTKAEPWIFGITTILFIFVNLIQWIRVAYLKIKLMADQNGRNLDE